MMIPFTVLRWICLNGNQVSIKFSLGEGNWESKVFGREEKIHKPRQTSKMAQHNLFFFYVKMYRVLLKVLARKGVGKDITYKEGKGGQQAQEHMAWRDSTASGHPSPRLTSHQERSTKRLQNRKSKYRQTGIDLASFVHAAFRGVWSSIHTLEISLKRIFIFLKIVFNILQQR